MGWYRSQPKIVEARQLGPESVTDIHRWVTERDGNAQVVVHANSHASVEIHNLEGMVAAHPSDWVLRGNDRRFFVMKDPEFRVSYRKLP